jgi:hypothetical protein
MAATSVQAQAARVEAGEKPIASPARGAGVVAWTGFLFALLQGLCTFFAAANGLRTAIGLGAIALTASQGAFVQWFHSSWLRRPMNGLAVAGAVLNLIVLWQIRRLRARPAAQWRVQPVSAKKLRGERMQMVLAVVTLVLVGIEEYLHFTLHGRL